LTLTSIIYHYKNKLKYIRKDRTCTGGSKKIQQEEQAMSDAVNCEYCVNYSYDDDYECYTCEVNLDEDEMVKFITGNFHQCPYFKMGDEYRIVRKQM
jgi:hypothetical protein